jgi:hypothetical protein
MSGVIEKEGQRQQRWADLGLADPLRVMGEERVARLYVPGFRSPKREALDQYFAQHPNERPLGW